MGNRQVQSKLTCHAGASERRGRIGFPTVLAGRLGLFSLALVAACASGSSHDNLRGKPAPPRAEVISPQGILVCPIEGKSVDPWISVPAMNRKLRQYPDFARASGLTEVKSCADGFLFWEKYEKYSSEFPYFDSNQPYEPDLELSPDDADTTPLTAEEVRAAQGVEPKIKNGTAGQLAPVVR